MTAGMSDNDTSSVDATLGVLFIGFMVAVVFYGLTFFRMFCVAWWKDLQALINAMDCRNTRIFLSLSEGQ